MADRPWTFLELTNSVCTQCLAKVEAKLVQQGDRVYLLKRCLVHGAERTLISTDANFYHLQRRFLKPGQLPATFNTETKWGCPYDCGICPDHEQHGCLAVVEVTDHCNLSCPVCYADSSPARVTHRSLEHVERMLDAVVRNELRPDVVQISGGEPTIHPDFWAILDAAKKRPIKHLMVNTNGLRLARDPSFAERLATYQPHFEVYLQFDGLTDAPSQALRGEALLSTKLKALEQLEKHQLATTLVVTLKRGVNLDSVGALIDFALTKSCVRGITFQPVQHAGRTEGFDAAEHRLTLSEVRQAILSQTKVFAPDDVLPVPCHPDCLAMAYALKVDGQVVPLTSAVGHEALLSPGDNTITYELSDTIKQRVTALFSTSHSPDSQALSLNQLLCCLPHVEAPKALTYANVFRVIIMQFMDAQNFDVRSVKRTCVHIVHPDGRLIPFDTYNLFYRDGKEHTLLAPLRQRIEASGRP